MCRLSPPALKNLVLHFRTAGGGECEKEKELLRAVDLREEAELRRSLEERERGKEEEKEKEEKEEGVLRKRLRKRRGRNFFILRRGRVTFTIFVDGGHVIVTGVRDLHKSLEDAVSDFHEVTGGEVRLERGTQKVVNSTYVGCLECADERRRTSTCRALAQGAAEGLSTSFRTQFFPGVRVRRSRKGGGGGGGGTANVFNNGKYVLVGVKSDEEADTLRREVCALIRTSWMTSTAPTSCVWTAGWSSSAS